MKKRFRAMFGIVATATVATALLVGSAPAQTINLPLSIAPSSGLPNINISTNVDPATAQSVCGDPADGVAALAAAFSGLAANPGFDAVSAAVLGGFAGNAADIAPAALYATAFIDPVTQDALATGNWDPLTGLGSVQAPDAPRPLKYIVAAVCLNVKPLTAIDSAAVLAAMQANLGNPPNPATGGTGDCAGPGFGDLFVPGGTLCAEQILGDVVPLLLDTENPRGTGIQGFCLLGPNGEDCPATAVTSEPTFTG